MIASIARNVWVGAACGLVVFLYLLPHLAGIVSILSGLLVLSSLLAAPPKKTLSNLMRKELLLPMLLFVGMAATYLWSTHPSALSKDLQALLSLMIMPIAFVGISTIPRKQKQLILSCFAGAGCLSVLIMYGYIATHNSFVEDLLLRYQPLHFILGLTHIYYSLYLSISALFCLYYTFYPTYSKLRWLYPLGFLLLLSYLHTYNTSRTGLLAFYAGVGSLLLALLFYNKKVVAKWGYLLLVLVPLCGIGFYYVLTGPLRHKVDVTIDDLQRWQSSEDINDWSISMRIASYHTALLAWQKNPIIGYGYSISDVEEALVPHYQAEYPLLKREAYKLPHNQFLYLMVGGGLLLLLLFLLWLASVFSAFLSKQGCTSL